MDFRFTPEQEAFRGEIRAFFQETLPDGWRGIYPDAYFEDEYWPYIREFTAKVAARGYLTQAWPSEYGGKDLPLMQQVLFQEEQAMARAPHRDLTTSINIVAPTVMVHGTDEQKRRFLPPISRGEHVYCQGFSEPEVGSDLASLQCSAVRDGDDYVVNGSKIWTSGAHRSTHCILLTRSDPNVPKHKGISMFLVPMDTPGITVRPIRDPNDVHYFNQVFFDNVRVSAGDRIGEENQGWYVTTTTLDFERSGIYRFAFNRRNLDEIHELALETSWRHGAAGVNPSVRHALADQMIGNQAGRLLAYRVAWMQSQGMVPNQEASAAKLWGSELGQTISQLAMRLLGLYGQIDRDSKFAVLEGHIKADYVNSVSRTLRGGASEIQRNIIATRGLGLPRG